MESKTGELSSWRATVTWHLELARRRRSLCYAPDIFPDHWGFDSSVSHLVLVVRRRERTSLLNGDIDKLNEGIFYFCRREALSVEILAGSNPSVLMAVAVLEYDKYFYLLSKPPKKYRRFLCLPWRIFRLSSRYRPDFCCFLKLECRAWWL